jgi:hypothetical protein
MYNLDIVQVFISTSLAVRTKTSSPLWEGKQSLHAAKAAGADIAEAAIRGAAGIWFVNILETVKRFNQQRLIQPFNNIDNTRAYKSTLSYQDKNSPWVVYNAFTDVATIILTDTDVATKSETNSYL